MIWVRMRMIQSYSKKESRMQWNRPEARALCLEDLDHFQHEAIEKVSKSLVSALEELARIPKSQSGSSRSVDPFRTSRLFFISGEAGGGKTTVYLSLREALQGGKQKIPDRLESFKELMANSRRLIWLEPLDLEPAAESTNFLAAILVRIEEAAGALAGGGKSGEFHRPGFLETGPKRIQGFQELRRLQSDVVLAWDGNVAQRAANLDSEVYAMEVLRVEKARLNVNTRLQETLEGVLPEERDGEEALFVLPVDDFYLRPDASLQLLRLLRMVSVPRLFILILGDLDVVEELFYQDLLGQLVDLAGDSVFRKGQQERILTSRASALSAHALRKLVPLAQRCRLQIMFELRALDFAPAQLDRLQRRDGGVADPEKERTLQNLLQSLKIDLPRAILVPSQQDVWKPKNLWEFLCLRDPKQQEVKSADYTYSGLAILDLPPREVVDLWFSLYGAVLGMHGHKDKTTLERVVEVVIQQTQQALAAETYLSVDDQKWCEDSIQGSPNSKRFLATGVLKVESQTDQNEVFAITSSTGAELEIFSHKAWSFGPNKELKEGFVGLGLAPRPRAWFTVLHDLLALSGEDRLLGDALPPRSDKLRWVRITKDGEAFWPLPAWPSFWHLDRFLFAWKQVVRRSRGMKKERKDSPDKLIAWLAFHWIRFATDVLLSNRKELEEKFQDFESLDAAWHELAEDRKALLDRSEKEGDFESQELAREWVRDSEVMLTESFPVDLSVLAPIKHIFGQDE
jgi:hypothetical protein